MEEKAIAILALKMKVDPTTLTLSTSFVHDLGANELDVVEYLINLEDEFNVALVDENTELFDTVGEIISYIKRVKKQ